MIAWTLFGSSAVGMNLSSALHEFGHALGIWLGGEQVTGFYL
jgi:predicted Zn-dependent protease